MHDFFLMNSLDSLNRAQDFFVLEAWPSRLLLLVSMETGSDSCAQHRIQGSDTKHTHTHTHMHMVLQKKHIFQIQTYAQLHAIKIQHYEATCGLIDVSKNIWAENLWGCKMMWLDSHLGKLHRLHPRLPPLPPPPPPSWRQCRRCRLKANRRRTSPRCQRAPANDKWTRWFSYCETGIKMIRLNLKIEKSII